MPLSLTLEQINRYAFHKQHLAPTHRLYRVEDLANELGPMRATPPTLPYVSMWARVSGFERSDLDQALYVNRSLVRLSLMHSQLYLLPQQSVAAYIWAMRPLANDVLSHLDDMVMSTRCGDQPGVDCQDLARRVLEVASVRGPMTIQEFASLLPEMEQRVYVDPDLPELGHSLLGTRLLPAMCAWGLMVRAKPQGGWKSTQYRYATMASWVPDVDLEAMDRPTALRAVVMDYIRVYGPVTVADIVQWLGGYSRRQILSVLRSLGSQLERLEIQGLPGEHYMARDQVEAARTAGPIDSVCLLPARDSYTMAYSHRERFLSGYRRDRIYGPYGDSVGTVWLDGRIVGTWGARMREQMIEVQFFQPADPYEMALVGERARVLAGMLDFGQFRLEMGTDLDQDPAEEAFVAPELFEATSPIG